MVIKARENLVGAWAFFAGLVIAILVGIFTAIIPQISILNTFVLILLALLGITVGYFVAEKDVQTFLLASVSLVIVSYMGISGLILSAAVTGINIGVFASSLLQSLLALFVPATIVVALKSVFSIAYS